MTNPIETSLPIPQTPAAGESGWRRPAAIFAGIEYLLVFLLFLSCSTSFRITIQSGIINPPQIFALVYILWRGIAGGRTNGKAEYEARWLTRGLFIFAGLAGILFLLSANWEIRRLIIFDWLTAGLVLVCLLRSPITDWKRIALLFIAAALPTAVTGIAQHALGIGLAPKDFSGWARDASSYPIYGLFSHSNDLAVFLYWPFLVAAGLAVAYRSWKRAAFAGLAVLFGLALYWTISRSTLITLIVVIILFFLAVSLRQRKWFLRVIAALAAIGVLGLILILATQSVVTINNLLSGRLYLWNNTWQIITQDPLMLPLGFLSPLSDARNEFWIPHNIYLLFWIQFGWIGPLLLAGAGIHLLRSGWIRYERLRAHRPAAILWAGMAGLFLVNGMVSLYFHEPNFLINFLCATVIWMFQIVEIDSADASARAAALQAAPLPGPIPPASGGSPRPMWDASRAKLKPPVGRTTGSKTQKKKR